MNTDTVTTPDNDYMYCEHCTVVKTMPGSVYCDACVEAMIIDMQAEYEDYQVGQGLY